MEQYREKIDEIDNKLMNLLVERLLIVKNIGLYKKQNNIPVLDLKREQLIFDKIDEKYKNNESNQFLKSIYAKMMVETKKIQH